MNKPNVLLIDDEKIEFELMFSQLESSGLFQTKFEKEFSEFLQNSFQYFEELFLIMNEKKLKSPFPNLPFP